MTNSSASISTSVIDVEFEVEKRQMQQQILDKNFIFIPPRYLTRMIQTGLMDSFVNMIQEVDKEEEEEEEEEEIEEVMERVFGTKRLHDHVSADADDDANHEEIKRARTDGNDNDNDDDDDDIFIQSIVNSTPTLFNIEANEEIVEGQTYYIGSFYQPVNSSHIYEQLL